MTTVEAHDLLDAVPGRDEEWVTIPSLGPWPVDVWPAQIVACASLVGWLEDCHTEADLIDAVRHFATCVRIGLFKKRQYREELAGVLRDVVEHRRRQSRCGHG